MKYMMQNVLRLFSVPSSKGQKVDYWVIYVMMIISWFEASQIQLHKELILWLLTTYLELTMCQMLLKVHSVQFSSVAQSYLTPCDLMNRSMPGLPVHHQLPESTQTQVSRRWCHPTVLSSVVPFSSCPQSFPASGSFPMSQFFTTGGQVLEFQL